MKTMVQKLRSRRGETLTETLCALLTIVLSSALLAGMLSAAVNLNATAARQDKAYFDELKVAEEREDDETAGSVKVTLKGDAKTYAVTYYGSGGKLTSYSIDKGED